jgi:hypothetical protein
LSGTFVIHRRALVSFALAPLLFAVGPPPAFAATSNVRDPVVTFATPGTKTVTLQACNALGCSTVTRTVVVLDPAPQVTGASASPTSVEPGNNVLLSGTATGRPPLTYTWRVARGAVTVATLTGPAATFLTGSQPPGDYTATLTVSNGFGPPASSAPLALTVRAGTATDLFTITPCRVLDTRAGWPLFTNLSRVVQVTGLCGIPANARAIVANVTAVEPSGAGHLVLYASNLPTTPVTSTVNFNAGQARANFALIALPTDGSGTLLALSPVATTHLLIDVSGYFLASP